MKYVYDKSGEITILRSESVVSLLLSLQLLLPNINQSPNIGHKSSFYDFILKGHVACNFDMNGSNLLDVLLYKVQIINHIYSI